MLAEGSEQPFVIGFCLVMEHCLHDGDGVGRVSPALDPATIPVANECGWPQLVFHEQAESGYTHAVVGHLHFCVHSKRQLVIDSIAVQHAPHGWRLEKDADLCKVARGAHRAHGLGCECPEIKISLRYDLQHPPPID